MVASLLGFNNLSTESSFYCAFTGKILIKIHTSDEVYNTFVRRVFKEFADIKKCENGI